MVAPRRCNRGVRIAARTGGLPQFQRHQAVGIGKHVGQDSLSFRRPALSAIIAPGLTASSLNTALVSVSFAPVAKAPRAARRLQRRP